MRSLLIILFLFTTQLFAKAEDPKVWLTWKNDPTSTMTIMWISSDSQKSDEVHYKKKSDQSSSKSSKGTHWKLPNKKPFLVHKVDLNGLEADTIYSFHFGDNKKSYNFRTMPKTLNQPIRFATGGDAYNKSFKRYEAMCKQVAKQNPRFAIIGGDISYAAASKGREENWKKWQEFFACWTKEMRDRDNCLIPLLVTIGNHEVTGSFNRSMKEAPFYYMFFEKATYDLSFGNYAHFTFLDSNHTQKIQGKQTDWLEKKLKANKNKPHRFAIYHVGAYPSSGKLDSQTSRLIRKHWVPLFEKYKIHACFESHDHAYKRTYPMYKGKKAKEGVVYIGDGSWGVPPRKPKDRDYLAVAKEKQQALIVELSSHSRIFKSVDPNGKVIDTYEQEVKN